MTNHTVITIGRQLGSGGKEVGLQLAEELGIKCYDKELLERAAKDSGLCQELFENNDEKPTNSFLYSLVMDTYSFGYSSAAFADMPINHKVFLAQFDTIKNIAKEGPCVIVGRCADYALSEFDNMLSVFVHADLEKRIRQKTDKRRASYYNYYTSKKWGDAASYNLSLDSGVLGIDGCVQMIKKAIEIKEERLAKNNREVK